MNGIVYSAEPESGDRWTSVYAGPHLWLMRGVQDLFAEWPLPGSFQVKQNYSPRAGDVLHPERFQVRTPFAIRSPETIAAPIPQRSEERRVGKESRSRRCTHT